MNDNGIQRYYPQWQERIGWKLFPNRHLDIPDVSDMKDCLNSRVEVHLSLIDRLRTLLSGKIEVTTKTATENVIGKTVSNSSVSVRPPSWLDRKVGS